jgi:hypothetical protein
MAYDPGISRNLLDRVLALLERQIAALESEEGNADFSEAQVKALMLLTKTLQAAGEAVQQQEKASDGQDAGPGDILEFRRKLEKQIAALGEEAGDEALS